MLYWRRALPGTCEDCVTERAVEVVPEERLVNLCRAHTKWGHTYIRGHHYKATVVGLYYRRYRYVLTLAGIGGTQSRDK